MTVLISAETPMARLRETNLSAALKFIAVRAPGAMIPIEWDAFVLPEMSRVEASPDLVVHFR